jgi:shikimate dehydrogenase
MTTNDAPAVTRLGVFGWPAGHSRSPAFQNAALQAAGLRDWRYQLLPVPPHLFEETVRALPGAGFRGVNVTLPHKEAALELADSTSPRATAIGAANTLLFDPETGAIEADNTDAPALIEALPVEVAGLTALVLGAGGSARAAIWGLLDAGAAEVRVWNRTAARAEQVAEELGATAVSSAEPADILVHCTSSGLYRSGMFAGLPIDSSAVREYGCVVDFVYGRGETPLVDAASRRGIPSVDGLDLLVRQGALSFEQFTGQPAPLDTMRLAVANVPHP